MVEGALDVTAEQLIEWTAYGRLMERDGNRSPLAAPQGLYACAGSRAGHELWLVLSVVGDAQWLALRRLLEERSWVRDARFDAHAGAPGVSGRNRRVVGSIPVSGLPFRLLGVDSWIRTPAPTLGQHNRDVLVGLLGPSAADLDELEREKVIGTRPEGLA